MAVYRVTSPDGAIYEVTAPDDASEQEVLARAQAFHTQTPAAGLIPAAASGATPNIPDAWRQRFRQSDQLLNLPPGTTERQIGAESTFNPNAVNSSGARGLAQIMPGTQRDAEKAAGRRLNPFNFNDTMGMHDFVWQNRLRANSGNRVQAALDYAGFGPKDRYSPDARDYLTKLFQEHWIEYDHADPSAVPNP